MALLLGQGLAVVVMVELLVTGCQASDISAQLRQASRTLPAAALAEHQDEDAVFLKLEEHWTFEKDGTVRQRHARQLKLHGDRPVREYGDPRIDYHKDQDKVVIHASHTVLPDGEVLPVPQYSFNLSAPDDVAGWPQYIGWEQTVVSFSGIQNDCILVLDYEVITKAGVRDWISGDVRLQQDYPVVERVISVTAPEGTSLHHRLDGELPAGAGEPAVKTTDGMTTYTWSLADLPSSRAEPHSLPWQERCGRLRFTTCPNLARWVEAHTRPVEAAAIADTAITTFATKTIENEIDPVEQCRLIAKKLHDTFNQINSYKTMWPLSCRPAGEIYKANYGNPLETAALCAAALKSLGLEVSPVVAGGGGAGEFEGWGAVTDARFAGVVLKVKTPDGDVWVHPLQGIIRNPGTWGEHWLLGLGDGDQVEKTYVQSRGDGGNNELQIAGNITVDGEGQATGELRIQLTGAFFDPEALKEASAQEALVKRLVGRVLTDFEMKGHSITRLADDNLRATASVASKDKLKELAGQSILQLGEGPAFLASVPLPLDRPDRRTAVDVRSPFVEDVRLTIEFPEDWAEPSPPASLAEVRGSWGVVGQTAEVDGNKLQIRRLIRVSGESIPPTAFSPLRDAINALRAPKSLVATCGKQDGDA